MSVPPVIAKYACVHCGALSQSSAGTCWLCNENKSAPNPFAVTGATLREEPDQPQTSKWDVLFTVLLGLCVVMTLLIGFGLSLEDRGLLVPFAIFMAPAYAVTIVRGMVQLATKRKAQPASLLVTFFVSLVVTVAIVIILIASACVMFFLMCVRDLSGMR